MAALLPRRSSRLSRFSRTAVIAAAVTLALPAPVLFAQAAPEAAPQPDVENGKYQFEGVLTRPEFVRSLPGDNFYPTTKLDTGAKVIVVGSKNNWLKILPPAGSFSYVQKAFVQVHGDGKQGKATSQLIVRAGSSLQPVMWVTQAKLEKGEPVEILGEEEQYFKIKPPVGAYLYVATDAVKPGQQVAVSPTGEVTPVAPAAAPATPAVAAAEPAPAPAPQAPAKVEQPPVVAETVPGSVIPPLLLPKSEQPAAPSTVPTLTANPEPKLIEPVSPEQVPTEPVEPETSAVRPVNPLAAARPLSAAEAATKLKSLEQEFAAASQLPLADQPLADLTAGYTQVSNADGTSELTRRIVESRLQTLKIRTESREQMQSIETARTDTTGKLRAQQAEQDEIRAVIKQSQVGSYTAVGTLRPSSLQVSRTPIYRLTDPQTGRTLAYVWATNPRIATSEGQFLGVRGEVKTDPRFNFKVITPTSVEAIDPNGLYTAYAAEIAPPSLLPRSTATISPEQ